MNDMNDMRNMSWLQVGKPLPAMKWYPEGCLFDIDNSGALLVYNFDKPTKKEIAEVGANKEFEIRFVEINGLLWVLTKAGDLNWTDTPYNPRKSVVEWPLKIPSNQGLLLTFIMTDASTSIVKSMRAIGLGHAFSESLISAASRLAASPMDESAARQTMRLVRLTYPTLALADMADFSCRLIGGAANE